MTGLEKAAYMLVATLSTKTRRRVRAGTGLNSDVLVPASRLRDLLVALDGVLNQGWEDRLNAHRDE